jgi:hypothetical protein
MEHDRGTILDRTETPAPAHHPSPASIPQAKWFEFLSGEHEARTEKDPFVATAAAELLQVEHSSMHAACSNGRGSVDEQEPPPTGGAQDSFSIGGTVAGLAGSGLVLQNNGGDDLPIAGNGAFTFNARLVTGAQYRVTVRTQPSNPAQVCTLASGSGTIGSTNVTSVRVTCASGTHAIGGAVDGLLGSGLVLRNNGGDDLPINSNGSFTFATELASGAGYNVSVRSQPSNPDQACTVANGRGTVGSTDATNVSVSCNTADFTIGGTVRDLEGRGLVLRNNGTDELTINADGSFTCRYDARHHHRRERSKWADTSRACADQG